MDVLAVLEEYVVEGTLKDDEFLTLCPFHHDTVPSCSINIKKEVFRCLACDARGDIYSFLAATTNISRAVIKRHIEGARPTEKILSLDSVIRWHKELLTLKVWLARLKRKGINLSTVKRYLLGFDGSRITIPIFDKEERVINVRRWKPKAIKGKMISIKGHGKITLYPLSVLTAETLIITEGELKALLLCQLGFSAITVTGGSGSWQDEFSPSFKKKTVYLCFDVDNAGKRGAQKVGRSLYRSTSEIYEIQLPLDKDKFPKGDITDYVVDHGKTKKDVQRLMKEAIKWEPVIYQETFDDEIYPVSLAESVNARYFNRIVQTKVIISAKDIAPFLIPFHIKLSCPKDQEICAFCKCLKQDEFKIDKKHPVILELVNIPTERQRRALRKIIGIPRRCDMFHFKILESMNIEEIRMIPQIQISQTDSEHVVRPGYYVGHGIETNANYEIQARICTQPETQHATLLVFNAEPAIDNLSTFELKENLDIFKPKEWTKEAIHKKLEELYQDLECNVTRIYKRPMLHLFYDLCYHSVLYIPFQDQIIKGWIEGLVLGDSGQGKTETILQLQKHYGLGERIDIKSSSVAGLLGGLAESGAGKRWFVTWGIIPLNDKRLVVLEEIKGAPEGLIGRLTETRSSGIAEIAKVEKARTNARVRLIWISNPRADRQILSYNYGVEAIKELIGNLEDIRRFDLAMVLTVKDVDSRWINLSAEKRPQVNHVFTAELCQQLILWAWSRKVTQVALTKEATDEILSASSKMGLRYSSRIPLVEAADQRLKLARLAAALAARTFSTSDDKTLIVRKCHVEYIIDFLEKIYSSSACGYLDYSNLIKREDSIVDAKSVKDLLKGLPFAKSVIETFLDTKIFNIFDVIDWTELENEEAKKLIGILVRNNAIKRFKRGYAKNSAFITLLKELRKEKLLDETRYDRATQEEF